MTWQLGLSRFIHGLPHAGHAADAAAAAPGPRAGGVAWPAVKPGAAITADREASLLPALIAALFDARGHPWAEPPVRVKDLLDLAGLDRAMTCLHLQGLNLPSSFYRGPMPRGCRQTALLEGLRALDAGLWSERGAVFDELTPTVRHDVLSAFEHGDLGWPKEAAERFMDCFVETATFAFLNWQLELVSLDATSRAALLVGLRRGAS